MFSIPLEIEKKRNFEDNSKQTLDPKKQKKVENNSNCKDKMPGFAVWASDPGEPWGGHGDRGTLDSQTN